MRWLPLIAIAGCGGEPEVQPLGDPSVLPHIEAWNSWLEPSDLERKYCKMSQSPFAFFRGTAHLYWMDLGQDPRIFQFGHDETRTWLQGDAHVQNFGSFDDDDARIVYDLNDFDEVVIADHQLDLWRLAISLILMAEEDTAFATGEIDVVVDTLTEAYLDEIDALVGNDDEDEARFDEDNTGPIVSDFLDDAEDDHDRPEMLAHWTDYDEDLRRLDLDHEDLEAPTAETRAALLDDLDTYLDSLSGALPADPAYFAPLDLARRRNQGLGSLGVPRYYLLIEGETEDWWDDRILDIKRQEAPAASASDPDLTDPDPFIHHGERVARGQKALALHVDDHLGTLVSGNESYSVRERSPWKEALSSKAFDTPRQLEGVATDWGKILANAHARADEDHDGELVPHSFEAALSDRTAGEHGAYRDLVVSIARPYALQVEAGWQAFEAFVEDSDLDCTAELDDG